MSIGKINGFVEQIPKKKLQSILCIKEVYQILGELYYEIDVTLQGLITSGIGTEHTYPDYTKVFQKPALVLI